jgi:hypothetical protein
LDSLAGAKVPHPIGEGGSVMFAYSVKRPYTLPFVVGWEGSSLVFLCTQSPQKPEGHGTDAAIDAYPQQAGKDKKKNTFS